MCTCICRGVEEILKHYPDQVNLKNGTDKTPLYFATLNGHADIVTYLLSQQVCYVVYTGCIIFEGPGK